MINYITGFSVYTLAMMGIIFIAFVVMKKCSLPMRRGKSHNKFLELETSLGIQQNKSIHVIRAGKERFLISTDPEKTNFLAKLEDNKKEHPQDNLLQMEHYKKQNTINTIEEDEAFFKGLIKKI